MRKNYSMIVLVLLVVCFVCFASSRAIALQTYTITDLGTLGGSESFAYAMNDNGHVVGEARLRGDTDSHAFLYGKGVMRDIYPINSQEIRTVGPTGINNAGQIASGLVVSGIYYPSIYDSKTGAIAVLGSLGGGTSFGFDGGATSINNIGQAVGWSYIDNIKYHAFLYSNGVMRDLGPSGGLSVAYAVNDAGVVVGTAAPSIEKFAEPFIYRSGIRTTFDPFGGSEGAAYDINNRGQVVGGGITADESAEHAFLYDKGVIADLGTLKGGRYSQARAINERGQIVGLADYPYDDVCFDPNKGGYVPCIKYAQHAFVYEKGVMTDLNSLIPANSGWDLDWAFDINNRGQIVGYGLFDGNYRAYILTPVH
jgi:probable HAF family extracellular repeat protein